MCLQWVKFARTPIISGTSATPLWDNHFSFAFNDFSKHLENRSFTKLPKQTMKITVWECLDRTSKFEWTGKICALHMT